MKEVANKRKRRPFKQVLDLLPLQERHNLRHLQGHEYVSDVYFIICCRILLFHLQYFKTIFRAAGKKDDTSLSHVNSGENGLKDLAINFWSLKSLQFAYQNMRTYHC